MEDQQVGARGENIIVPYFEGQIQCAVGKVNVAEGTHKHDCWVIQIARA